MAAPSRRGSHSQPFDLDTAPELDDDGRAARTGNLWTCVAHIITGVIGAGVLALSWSVAQLGWVAGPIAMLCFAGVTYVSAVLLSHCYRSPVVAGAGGGEEDSSPGKMRRNYTYMDAVRALLGRKHVYVCGTLPNSSIIDQSQIKKVRNTTREQHTGHRTYLVSYEGV